MTQNRRIALNIVATYGRSLYALVCGLFTARWVLMALGHEDFGLYGVVGGLVVFIGLVNNLLATALSRFYAVSVGAVRTAENKDAALMACREWFSSAVLIHTVVPFVLMVVGWPLGEYAIREGWIAVPPGRLDACLWVFRFSCLSCFVGMVTIPYNAMYTAKQYIAELTVYSFVTTTLNMAFFYYMVTHPGVWLTKYAAWMALMGIAPALIIACRAHSLFPECRLLPQALFSRSRITQLASFAGWQAFGVVGSIFRNQGIAILLNRHVEFGPMRNSSMSVANQMAVHTDTLAGAMVSAFQPAIANAYGARELDRMRSFAFFTCKFGTILSLAFALPLALELPEVLSLWLKEPPIYAAGLCWAILAAHIIDRTTIGHQLAVSASGRIAGYQACLGGALILALPLAAFSLYLGWGVYSVGWVLILTGVICAWGRVGFARTIVGLSARHWFARIFFPLALVIGAVVGIGLLLRLVLPQSFCRLVVTTIAADSLLFALTWFIALDSQERKMARERFFALYRRFSHG